MIEKATQQIDRRFFFRLLAGGVAVVATAKVLPANIIEVFPPMTTDEIIRDLKMMCGVQTSNAPVGLAFMMKTKYNQTPTDIAEKQFLGLEPYKEMALCIDKYPTALCLHYTLPQWRIETAKSLVCTATMDLLTDEENNHPNPKRNMFATQRRRSKIAKVTRRGYGNRLVGCKKGFELLGLPEGYFKSIKPLEVVTFETGEVTSRPFVIVGYNGKSPYDAGLALLKREGTEGKIAGGFAYNDPHKYWRRII